MMGMMYLSQARKFVGLFLITPAFFLLSGQQGCPNQDVDGDGWTTSEGDCDDNNAEVNPGAAEICNGLDDDCDDEIDDGFDADADSYTTCDGDCNDTNAGIHPGATETCNNTDDNCNSQIDEGFDADNDSYSTCGGDCNDNNAAVYPGRTETCNSIDDDCDGSVDEGLLQTYYRDQDGDTYGSSSQTTQACSKPSGYVSTGGDCNDSNAAINPGATEVCDAVDNDCDGSIDENVKTTYYLDQDSDAYGLTSSTTQACSKPTGYASVGGDCNDSNAAINPAATEVCDSVDNDCDGSIDENVKNTYYVDSDNDGYGLTSNSTQACTRPTGYATVGGDCNDSNASIYPGATEQCNGVDDDCDGVIDDNVTYSTYYRDADSDGYGTTATTTQACTVPSGYSAISGDCNDSNAAIHPGATETCNSTDDDCDGSIDEGLGTTWYRDADNDTYGTSATTTSACSKPSGYVSISGDCNDSNAAINPGATEVCDSVDNDCDSSVDEGVKITYYRDQDADNYGLSSNTTQACSKPSGYASIGGDCNDSNSAINPGATEVCDSVDNDCDGSIDENLTTKYYDDDDIDSYGDPNAFVNACSKPSGKVTRAGDCNDKMWSINPDGYELCNGMDDDCDGLVDASDTFDVTTGDFGTFNSTCNNYDRVLGAEIPYLKVHYQFGPVVDDLVFYDSVLVGGHNPGASTVSGWPSTCRYFDAGYFWFNESDPTDIYAVKFCLSKNTDSTGGDEVYLQINYNGITLKGVFNNVSDSDTSDYDLVDFASSESSGDREVWYLSDTADVSGTGYTASMDVLDCRIEADIDN